jgi:cytochrome c-type biogenesis protein CcmE
VSYIVKATGIDRTVVIEYLKEHLPNSLPKGHDVIYEKQLYARKATEVTKEIMNTHRKNYNKRKLANANIALK